MDCLLTSVQFSTATNGKFSSGVDKQGGGMKSLQEVHITSTSLRHEFGYRNFSGITCHVRLRAIAAGRRSYNPANTNVGAASRRDCRDLQVEIALF